MRTDLFGGMVPRVKQVTYHRRMLIAEADRLADVARARGASATRLQRAGLSHLVRDQRGLCGICGGPFSKDHEMLEPTVDHVVPFAAGGGNERANRQAAHFVCNNLKGSLSLDEARRLIAHLRPADYISALTVAPLESSSAHTQPRRDLGSEHEDALNSGGTKEAP